MFRHMRGSLARAAAATLWALSLAPASAANAAPHALDLSKDASTVFTTRAPDDALGTGVAAAGDVNGDGNQDVLIGAPASGRNGRAGSGSAYVVFGSPAFTPRMPLDTLGQGGFRIDGAPPEVKVNRRDLFFGEEGGPLTDSAGYAVAGLGDVNGDGLADIAVSAPDASPHKRIAAGAVYVVFGRRSSEPVDLKSLSDGGYRIAGEHKGKSTGFTMAPAGDVNGDGRGDLLVGTFFAIVSKNPGSVFVVFSHPDTRPVDLANLGADGIAIRGSWPVGPYLAPLGDVNGDKLDDVIVGSPPARKDGRGRAYVIHGRAAPGTLRLRSLGSAGYSIRDSGRDDYAGNLGGLVGGPGDVNGDGRPDVVVGGGLFAHVVFSDGTDRAVDVHRAAARSIRIANRELGLVAGGPGDANGDGMSDLLFGAGFGSPRCHDEAGSAVVVYGRAQPGRLRLADLGSGGYSIDGVRPEDHAGDSVAWTSDVNGDGHSDVLIGAPGAGARGRAYLVPGRSGGVPEPPGGPCLEVKVPPQSLGRVVRTRRLRVSVTSRPTGRLILTAVAPGHHEVAAGSVTFREPGTKRARLTLNRPGRRMLARRKRVRLRVVAEAFPFAEQRGSATVVLRR